MVDMKPDTTDDEIGNGQIGGFISFLFQKL